jgi:hypothetical protein
MHAAIVSSYKQTTVIDVTNDSVNPKHSKQDQFLGGIIPTGPASKSGNATKETGNMPSAPFAVLIPLAHPSANTVST